MNTFIQAMFDESVLDAAAARYGVATSALWLLGGFQSYVYEFEYQGQARILRISHTSHRSVAQVHGEAAWINYLADRGIPAARVLPAPDGTLVQKLTAREGAFIATAFERAPGTRVSHEALGPALYRQMGILMGRMHVLTQDYVPPTPAYRRPTWYDQAAGFAARCLPDSEQVAIDTFDAELAHLQTLPTERDSYGLAHTDVHLGNLHIHDGQLTLFDFDDCQYTWFMDDIAIALLCYVACQER
jgi:amicoumacin kinase